MVPPPTGTRTRLGASGIPPDTPEVEILSMVPCPWFSCISRLALVGFTSGVRGYPCRFPT
jgi:hypothetical protein